MQTKKIRTIMIDKDIKLNDLADRLDKSSQNLNIQLKKDNFRESDLQAIAEALDCELVIQFKDKETGKVF